MPNARKVIKVLEECDADFLDQEMKKIEEAVMPIMDRVYNLTPERPLYNWGKWRESRQRQKNLNWSYRRALTGLQVRKSGKRTIRGGTKSDAIALINMNPQAAIYEIAGMAASSENDVNPGRSECFRRTMNTFHGHGPRLLVKVWREEKGVTKVAKAVRKAIEAMERRANEIMRKDAG